MRTRQRDERYQMIYGQTPALPFIEVEAMPPTRAERQLSISLLLATAIRKVWVASPPAQ
jgi:hypothetical protein